jgi:hypothetical protein
MHSPGSPRLSSQWEERARRFGRRIAGQGSHYHDRSGATFQIVTLVVVFSLITLCGLILHLVHPLAADDRLIENAMSPSLPPPAAPVPPRDSSPLPPHAPLPASPPAPPPLRPIDWWQRRRPLSETLQTAWVELGLVILFCFVCPPLLVWWRQQKMRRQRISRVLSQLGGSSRLRHARLVESAPDTPTGRWQRARSQLALASIPSDSGLPRPSGSSEGSAGGSTLTVAPRDGPDGSARAPGQVGEVV